MTTVLQRTLQGYLDKNGLTVAGMERDAGLKINVIRNILRGQSKRPTAETLQALSRLMGCSIQDLLSEDETTVSTKPHSQTETKILSPEILTQIVEVVFQVCKEKGRELTIRQLSGILEEVYTYSMAKKPPAVDKTFIEWYVMKVVG